MKDLWDLKNLTIHRSLWQDAYRQRTISWSRVLSTFKWLQENLSRVLVVTTKRIFIELMTSDRKVKASSEGSR